MNDNSILMDKAKSMLTGKWMQAAFATLVYVLILYAALSIGEAFQVKFLTGVGAIIQLAVYGPLTFGYILYLSCLTDTGFSNLDLMFRGINRFMETFIAGLLYYLIVFVGYFLFIIPGIMAFCGLSMTFYIMADDANISGIDALRLSWKIMDGHKMDFFCLQLRFIGWAILATLTCGIGFFWLFPYIYVTNLNFYRRIRYGV